MKDWYARAVVHTVAVTTGISFACANFIATVATLKNNWVPQSKHIIGIYAAVLISQGGRSLLYRMRIQSLKYPLYDRNDQHFWRVQLYRELWIMLIAIFMCTGILIGVRMLRFLNNISIWWHALGTTALVIAVLAKAPTHQSGAFVFTSFYDGTGSPGWGERASHAYVAVIGILMAQYTLSTHAFHYLF